MIKIAGIILGAGFGSRIKCIKQLLVFGNKSMIERIVNVAELSKLTSVFLILGYNANNIINKISIFRTKIIITPYYSHGQSSSINVGCFRIEKEYDAIMFILGDHPFITRRIINKLIKKSVNIHNKILIPTYNGIRGHPIIFGRNFIHKFNHLSGDVGGRILINEYIDNIIEVPLFADDILVDIDTYDVYFNFCF